jgi:hypothetical protein
MIPIKSNDRGADWVLRCLTLCLILAICSEFSLGQQTKPDYLALQRALARLMNTPVANAESTRQTVIDVRDDVEAFREILVDANASSSGEVAAVNYIATGLEEVAKEPDPKKTLQLVNEIKDDLDLKISYYRSRMGIAGATRGLVKVTVNTLRDNKPVPGLLVYCNESRWKDSEKQSYPFPMLSSPTETYIQPGVYWCFAVQGEPAQRGFRGNVRVGLDGSPILTLDILITK